jgi:hypothetical protein
MMVTDLNAHVLSGYRTLSVQIGDGDHACVHEEVAFTLKTTHILFA